MAPGNSTRSNCNSFLFLFHFSGALPLHIQTKDFFHLGIGEEKRMRMKHTKQPHGKYNNSNTLRTHSRPVRKKVGREERERRKKTAGKEILSFSFDIMFSGFLSKRNFERSTANVSRERLLDYRCSADSDSDSNPSFSSALISFLLLPRETHRHGKMLPWLRRANSFGGEMREKKMIENHMVLKRTFS